MAGRRTRGEASSLGPSLEVDGRSVAAGRPLSPPAGLSVCCLRLRVIVCARACPPLVRAVVELLYIVKRI